jgi:hypothetical protein
MTSHKSGAKKNPKKGEDSSTQNSIQQNRMEDWKTFPPTMDCHFTTTEI